MHRKYHIKEAWLLDNEGNKVLKLEQLNPDEVFPDRVDLSCVRGGIGSNIFKEIFKPFGSVGIK